MPALMHLRLVRATTCLVLAIGVAVGCTTSGSGSDSDSLSVSGSGGTPGPTATSVRASSTTATTAEDDVTTSSRRTSTTDDGEAPGAPDACDLITEDDAATAFGEAVEAGEQDSDECWWHSKNDLKTVNIIRRSDDVDEWRSGYQNEHWEAVDRGDEGYAGRTLDSIVFRLGDTMYEVNVIYSTTGDPEQVVSDLADTVLSRL